MARKKGSLNKDKKAVQDMADELNVSPFKILLYIASNNWKALGYDSPVVLKLGRGGVFEEDRISLADRRSAASDCCQYLHSKRKAIEIREVPNPEDDRPLGDLSDEELDAL